MALSNYTKDKIHGNIFQDTQWTKESALYIALLSTNCVASDTGTNLTSGSGGTGVEISTSGSAYSRLSVPPSSSANWTLTSHVISNTDNLSFATATSNYSAPVVALALVNASTNGSIIMFGTLTNAKSVSTGDVFTVNAGNFTSTLT